MQKASLVKMLEEGKTKAEIAEKFNCTKQELSEYLETLFKVPESTQSETTNKVEISDGLIEDTLKLLKQSGMELTDAVDLINRTAAKITVAPVDAEEFKQLCFKNFSSKDMMITSAEGGRKGVVIATGASSEKADSSMTRVKAPQQGVFHINSPIGSNQNTKKI